jgi:hypothetical protein
MGFISKAVTFELLAERMRKLQMHKSFLGNLEGKILLDNWADDG